jgi:pyridoxine/pyridoxamine 5'-phosphate oxidase
MALTKNEILRYVRENKSIVLATAQESGQPDLRTLGGYNFDGFTLYFGTSSTSDKVKQIDGNNRVSVLLQQEGQDIKDFKNITIYGTAERLTGADYEAGKKKIRERRPNAEFDEKVKYIYKVTARQIKVLDFSEKPEDRITIIYL